MLGRTLANVINMKEGNAGTAMMRLIETQAIVRLALIPAHLHPHLVQGQARAVKEKGRKEKAKEREAKHRPLTERKYHVTSSYVAYAAKVIRATSNTMSKNRKNSRRKARRTRIFTRAGPEPSGR